MTERNLEDFEGGKPSGQGASASMRTASRAFATRHTRAVAVAESHARLQAVGDSREHDYPQSTSFPKDLNQETR